MPASLAAWFARVCALTNIGRIAPNKDPQPAFERHLYPSVQTGAPAAVTIAPWYACYRFRCRGAYLIEQRQEMDMNRDRIAGSWKQVSGSVQEQWSRLIGDEAGVSAAQYTRLAGSVQLRHARSSEEAERQLRDFLSRNRNWNPSGR